jgi:hypothetical protein
LSGIGSSKGRFQPRSATGLDRLAQSLHGEFDIVGLQVAQPVFWRRCVDNLKMTFAAGHARRFDGAMPRDLFIREKFTKRRAVTRAVTPCHFRRTKSPSKLFPKITFI